MFVRIKYTLWACRTYGKLKIDDLCNRTYAQLLEIQKNNSLLYEIILKVVHKRVEFLLKKKKKIHIVFIVNSITTWIGDEIPQILMQDERYDVRVIFAWQSNLDKDYEKQLFLDYFKSRSIPYSVSDENFSLESVDIAFYCIPYAEMLEGHLAAIDVPLSTLVCYTGYGFLLAKLEQWQFNLPIHNICWKNFIHTPIYKDMAKEYCNIGTYGMIYSGYPKMDTYYMPECNNDYNWKGNTGALRIIWAPHHALVDEPFTSTFDLNYRWFLDYAKNHPDTTSWVVKPHSLLRIGAVKAGVFSTTEEYESYLNEWRQLPNATVELETYSSIFKSSDCLITDSVSFRAEYFYTKKPLLILKNPKEESNALGTLVNNAWGWVSGNSWEEIAKFIEDMYPHKNMTQQQQDFYSAYLDYYLQNGSKASEKIAREIMI